MFSVLSGLTSSSGLKCPEELAGLQLFYHNWGSKSCLRLIENVCVCVFTNLKYSIFSFLFLLKTSFSHTLICTTCNKFKNWQFCSSGWRSSKYFIFSGGPHMHTPCFWQLVSAGYGRCTSISNINFLSSLLCSQS